MRADGTVLYTPRDGFTGADRFVYTLTDAAGGFGTATVTVAPPPVLGPPRVSDAAVGVPYTQTLAVQDSAAPCFNFRLAAGALPPGLTLTRDGTLAGVTTVAGAYKFTVSATDTDNRTLNRVITLTALPGGFDRYTLAAPSSTAAGVPFPVTVAARDRFGNVVTGHQDTVQVSGNDRGAASPASVAVTGGVGTITVTLTEAGPRTLALARPSAPATTVSSASILVAAGAESQFVLGAPTLATAGTATTITVTAVDRFGNTVTGYTGAVHLSSTDANAVLPPDAKLTAGSGRFAATWRTAGTQTVTATDSTNTSVKGISGTVRVGPAATGFGLGVPNFATTGAPVTVTVTALDQYGNVVTGYTGTVRFASSDPTAVLPPNSRLTNGVGTFTVALKRAGSQTITGTDTTSGAITSTSSAIQVSGAAARFAVSASSITTAGASLVVTVTALDQSGYTSTGYTGTFRFTSTDGTAILPANSKLTNGVGTFSITLKKAGSQTFTATDTVTTVVTGTSNPIKVNAAPTARFTVNGPSSATAGIGSTITVTAIDAFGNRVTGYAGIVRFASSDLAALLPANGPLTNGVGTFLVTLKKSGLQTVTVTDTVTSTVTNRSNSVTVAAAAAARFALTVPLGTTAGTAVSVTVTALDAFGNTATGYTGSVRLSSSDVSAVLPATLHLVNGVGTFNVTLKRAGNQTVSATDAVNGSMTSTSGTIGVAAANAVRFAVTAPVQATAGTNFTVTVTALDAYGNTATGYTGSVKLSSGDSTAVLPPNSTLLQGVRTFTVQLKKRGSQTLTATDALLATLTGVSAQIVVG